MRIVLCCRVYPTHRPGGMPFVCQDRAEALAAAGHDVHVSTTGNHGHPAIMQSKNLTVHFADSPAEVYSDQYAQACQTLCAKLRPDVVHLDSFDLGRLWWRHLPGNPRVGITLHGFGPGAFLTAWNRYRVAQGPVPQFNAGSLAREAEALRLADVVIGVSIHEEWMLRDFYGLSQARLIYNPIPEYFFAKPAPIPDKAPFLCAAISGHGERGFDLAQAAAHKAGLEVATVSKVPRVKMPGVYDSCRAVLLPTFYAQGYDLTVAEAIARRRMVIVSDTGSYLREAEESDCGWIRPVPLGRTDALIEAMLRPAPTNDCECLSARHRPSVHIQDWLEAME